MLNMYRGLHRVFDKRCVTLVWGWQSSAEVNILELEGAVQATGLQACKSEGPPPPRGLGPLGFGGLGFRVSPKAKKDSVLKP